MADKIVQVSDIESDYCFILCSTDTITFVGELDAENVDEISTGAVHAYSNETGEELYVIRPSTLNDKEYREFGTTGMVLDNKILIGCINYDDTVAQAYLIEFDEKGYYDEVIYKCPINPERYLDLTETVYVGVNVAMDKEFVYISDTGYGDDGENNERYGAIFKFNKETGDLVKEFHPEVEISEDIREFGGGLSVTDSLVICSTNPAYAEGEYLVDNADIYYLPLELDSYKVLDKPDIEDFGNVFDVYTTTLGYTYLAVTNTRYNKDEPKAYLYSIEGLDIKLREDIGAKNDVQITAVSSVHLTDDFICLQVEGSKENIEVYAYSGNPKWAYFVADTNFRYSKYFQYPIRLTDTNSLVITLTKGRVIFIIPPYGPLAIGSGDAFDSLMTSGLDYLGCGTSSTNNVSTLIMTEDGLSGYTFTQDIPKVLFYNTAIHTGNNFKTIYGNRGKLNATVKKLYDIYASN